MICAPEMPLLMPQPRITLEEVGGGGGGGGGGFHGLLLTLTNVVTCTDQHTNAYSHPSVMIASISTCPALLSTEP